MDTERDAYAEGADAFLGGTPETANPYEVHTDEHLIWNDGWRATSEAGDDDEVDDGDMP